MRTARTGAALLAVAALTVQPYLLAAVMLLTAAVVSWAAKEIGDTPQ